MAGIVLALGGGGARGLAQIGVLEVLAANGIAVRAVAGTSVGAKVGAFVACGVPVAEMVELATSFDWKLTMQLFLPDLPTGGLISGKRILQWLKDKLGEDRAIERLAVPYVAIATNLESGEEVVIDHGPITEAVRASISLPGTLAPLRLGELVMVDGGVVNPIPFDVARQRFGGPVVAVAAHGGAQAWERRRPRQRRLEWKERVHQLLAEAWMKGARDMREGLEAQAEALGESGEEARVWHARLVMERSLEIGGMELIRLRAAVQPPDLTLVPDVGDIGTLEFYRAKEAIEAGRAEAEAKLEELLRLAGQVGAAS
ncbi:MAG: patatin-like phospholipase family protein [Bryobacteraceae bacterium]